MSDMKALPERNFLSYEYAQGFKRKHEHEERNRRSKK